MGGTLAFEDAGGVLRQAGTAYPYPVSSSPSPAGTPGSAGPVAGHASASDTSSTLLIAAVSGRSINLQGWSFGNSGDTTVVVTFQDGNGGSQIGPAIIVPAGGGNNMAPIGSSWGKTTAGNGLYFAASADTTSVEAGAIGYAQ